jgi:phosphoribosylglycinamide formyltransferase-1
VQPGRALPIVVLASGRGGTFAALVAAQRGGTLPADIRAVLSDRRTAPVLRVAEQAGIPAVALRPRDFADRDAFDRALFERVAAFEPRLVVLAGYMRVVGAAIAAAWAGRMINLHPSLLPLHPGLDTYRRALAAGDATFGASVHYVTDQLDGGPIIAQVALPVLPGDSPETMAGRLRPLERALLVDTIALIATGRVALRGQAVEFDGRPLAAPLGPGANHRLPGL